MKKLIISAIVTIAIASTALIAVPALARGPVAQVQTPAAVVAPTLPALPAATNSLYMGYGSAFCAGGLALGDTTTLQKVADTLGITYDQLVADLNNGQSIASIAAAQKVDLSKVVDAVVAAQTDVVNTLVKDGYITQTQADAILANLRIRVEAVLSQTPVTGYTGYGYGCYGINGVFTPVVPATGTGPAVTVPPAVGYCPAFGASPLTGYGPGMMGGFGRGMMGW